MPAGVSSSLRSSSDLDTLLATAVAQPCATVAFNSSAAGSTFNLTASYTVANRRECLPPIPPHSLERTRGVG